VFIDTSNLSTLSPRNFDNQLDLVSEFIELFSTTCNGDIFESENAQSILQLWSDLRQYPKTSNLLADASLND
jgi:hypothetical protein